MRRSWFVSALVLIASGFVPVPAYAVTVYAASTSMTPIGNVIAGKTYRITASGTADLYAAWDGGRGLPFSPDGKPRYQFVGSYAAFYPNGLDYDPSNSPSAYGIGGPQRLYGALLGSFTSSPQPYSDYFVIGSSYRFTATASGPVYAKVNDIAYSDNAGSYDVSLFEVIEVNGYTYDALGRLTQVTRNGGPSSGTQAIYGYDAASNRTRVQVTGAPH